MVTHDSPAASTAVWRASLLCILQLSIMRMLRGAGYCCILGSYWQQEAIKRQNKQDIAYNVFDHEIKEFSTVNRSLYNSDGYISIQTQCREDAPLISSLKRDLLDWPFSSHCTSILSEEGSSIFA